MLVTFLLNIKDQMLFVIQHTWCGARQCSIYVSTDLCLNTKQGKKDNYKGKRTAGVLPRHKGGRQLDMVRRKKDLVNLDDLSRHWA